MEASARYTIPKQPIKPIPFSCPKSKTKQLQLPFKIKTISASKKDEWTPPPSLQVTPKKRRNSKIPIKNRRSLITISTASDWKWNEKWTCEYVFSLGELRLRDLAEDGYKDAEVFITLTIEKHASFGFSVHGRIITTLGRKCIICSTSYNKQINTTFDVWVLPSTKDTGSDQLRNSGDDDPSLSSQPYLFSLSRTTPLSVIYVKPGSEADLDSLIQDTIRLTTSVKETCSEICEKTEQRWQCIDTTKATSSIDGRWSALLKLRNKAI
ncbi:Large ribosomal rna subunit accumulation protein yced-like protein [Thalictrum thalictroides]|uniref:Large ribosomal rna subunit accumulation protein yced-like protein n=1 Tax=Thalictrum thalictroides TaxID=46969 RepID=A0A7J6XFL9_THATH|nr:Large ribosomal rna subunit accumulation protein yced-like protein [Thalictrum thalictroides]